jgi:arsenite methyltransferase
MGDVPDASVRPMWSGEGMANLLMRLLDPAFGHPRGPLGRLGGALMARGNAEQEERAVQQAALRPGERVLVVGHGPGLGVKLAAAAVGPSGRVTGVDPSETMRQMAAARCAAEIAAGAVELRPGTAEHSGCDSGTVDAVISVNNVMLWELAAGLAELSRVLRPGGRLVVSVHRHVLDVPPGDLRAAAEANGFGDVSLTLRDRRLNTPAVELLAVPVH